MHACAIHAQCPLIYGEAMLAYVHCIDALLHMGMDMPIFMPISDHHSLLCVGRAHSIGRLGLVRVCAHGYVNVFTWFATHITI